MFMARSHVLSLLALIIAPMDLFGQCELIVPQITFQADCTVGGTLRWTGLFMYGNQAILNPCGGPYVYSLGNGVTSSYGTIANGWVQESPTSWRYNAPLPAGFYYVFIYPENAQIPPASPACDQWSGYCAASCMSVCFADAQFNVPTSPGDCGVNVNVRAWLDGALSSGTVMNDGLRANGLIPTTEPYSALGYAYTGAASGASISPSLLAVTGSNAVVDWVILELRSSLNTVAWSKPALLRRNGQVMDVDGDGHVNFPVSGGNYRLAMRHRNHLGIMTSAVIAMSETPAMVDMGSSATAMYGTDPRVQKGTVWCLWAGDATGNGAIKYTGAGNDRDPILTAIGGSTPNAVVTNVYDRRDTNLDGVIKYTGAGNDRDIILTNVGSTTPNGTRVQQLP